MTDGDSLSSDNPSPWPAAAGATEKLAKLWRWSPLPNGPTTLITKRVDLILRGPIDIIEAINAVWASFACAMLGPHG